MNLLGQVEQFQFAALVADAGEGTHQLADARAVDVIDLAEIKQDCLTSFAHQIAHRVAQDDAAFAQRDTPAEVHNRHPIYLPGVGLHGHWETSLSSPAAPGTCLI